MIPESFFTWDQLSGYAGATIAVILFVEFTKDLPGIKSIPTRIWAYIIAAVLLVLSTVFSSDNITPAAILLCLINAVIVAMTAVGGYDITHGVKAE